MLHPQEGTEPNEKTKSGNSFTTADTFNTLYMDIKHFIRFLAIQTDFLKFYFEN